LLLCGWRIPLGLTALVPVIVNIVSYHALMAPAGLPLALVVSALALFLLWRYRSAFAGLVKDVPVRVDSHGHQTAVGVATANS
jgi:putative oxidoreductase